MLPRGAFSPRSAKINRNTHVQVHVPYALKAENIFDIFGFIFLQRDIDISITPFSVLRFVIREFSKQHFRRLLEEKKMKEKRVKSLESTVNWGPNNQGYIGTYDVFVNMLYIGLGWTLKYHTWPHD